MKTTSLKLILLSAVALVPALGLAAPQDPESTDPTAAKFAGRTASKPLRVLLAGSGSSHDFPRFFLGTDAQTLTATGGMDVAATPNLEEVLTLLPQADVLVFSGNHDQWGKPEFQKLLNEFADSGKGLVFVHAATWTHPTWENYNRRFIAGATSSHGKGEFTVTVKNAAHPIMKGVPATFHITDESYRHEFLEQAKVQVLAENTHEGKTHASIWLTEDPKTKIVNITLGHDDAAHDNAAYKTILINSVNWVAGR
ncbi:MAG: ThuA domain-containing protein [Luteolibacter sp.]